MAAVRVDRPIQPFTSTPAAPVQPGGPTAEVRTLESTSGRPLRQTPVLPALSPPPVKPTQPAGPPALPASEPPRRDPPRYRRSTPTLGTSRHMPATPTGPAAPPLAAESAGAQPIRQKPGLDPIPYAGHLLPYASGPRSSESSTAPAIFVGPSRGAAPGRPVAADHRRHLGRWPPAEVSRGRSAGRPGRYATLSFVLPDLRACAA